MRKRGSNVGFIHSFFIITVGLEMPLTVHLTVKLGCYCASGFVRDVSGVSSTFGACISMAACPPLQNSQIFNPPSIANDDGKTWNDQLNLIDFNDLIPNTDCLKEPARGIF